MRTCQGCGCHRSIHEKVMAVENVASLLSVSSQQTSHVGYSAVVMEPSKKRLEIECANISQSIKVGDCGKAFETGDGLKFKSDHICDMDSCSIVEM